MFTHPGTAPSDLVVYFASQLSSTATKLASAGMRLFDPAVETRRTQCTQLRGNMIQCKVSYVVHSPMPTMSSLIGTSSGAIAAVYVGPMRIG